MSIYIIHTRIDTLRIDRYMRGMAQYNHEPGFIVTDINRLGIEGILLISDIASQPDDFNMTVEDANKIYAAMISKDKETLAYYSLRYSI